MNVDSLLTWPLPPKGYIIPADDRPPPKKEDVYIDPTGFYTESPRGSTPEYLTNMSIIQDDMYLDNDALTQFDFNADQQAQRRKAQRPILASPEPKPMASTGVVYTTPTFHKNQSTSDMYLNMADIAARPSSADAYSFRGEGAAKLKTKQQDGQQREQQRARSSSPIFNFFRKSKKPDSRRGRSASPTMTSASSRYLSKKKMKESKAPPGFHAIDNPPPPYFHGKIDEFETNDRLWQAGMKEGLFLVREVENDRKYILSVVREDKVEHYPISRSVRPNGKPGHHFILNDVIRLWLACCVDEIVAEILTVPELRFLLNGSSKQLLNIALGHDGKLNYLQAIVEHKTGLLDPRVHMERNGKVARLNSLLAEGHTKRPKSIFLPAAALGASRAASVQPRSTAPSRRHSVEDYSRVRVM